MSAKPVKFGSRCAVCGHPIMRRTAGTKWKHKRGAPGGGPHDHRAVAPKEES